MCRRDDQRPAELIQCHGSATRHQPYGEGSDLTDSSPRRRGLFPEPDGEVVLELRDFLPHALQLLVRNGIHQRQKAMENEKVPIPLLAARFGGSRIFA
jgi:hypothetical protein